MSLTAYSKFGQSANLPNGLTTLGETGPIGVGFKLTVDGNYDIVGKDFVNVGDAQLTTISDTGAGYVSTVELRPSSLVMTGDINLQSHNITTVGAFDGTTIRLTDKMLITDDATILLTDNVADIHIASTGNASIYIEGDTDNVGADIPFLQMTSNGGGDAFSVNATGNNSHLEFLCASNIATPGFQFTIGAVGAKAKGALPAFVGPYVRPLIIESSGLTVAGTLNMQTNAITAVGSIGNLGGTMTITSNVAMSAFNIENVAEMQIGTLTAIPPATVITISNDIDMSTKNIYCNDIYLKGAFYNAGTPADIQFGNNIDMQTNNIVNVGTLDFATTPANDDTQTQLLVANSTSGTVQYRTVASLPVVNPFNQSLNTTDSPTFNNLTVNGNLDMTQGNINNLLQLNNTTASITCTPQTAFIMASGKNINISDGYYVISNPLGTYNITTNLPGVSGFSGALFKFGSELFYNVGTYLRGISDPYYDRSTVNQLTNIGTAVTLNTHAGIITTQTANAVGDSLNTFVVNNSLVTANSIINANVLSYSGTYITNGIPIAVATAPGAGSFSILIINSHSLNPLNGTLTIQFSVSP